MGRRRMFYTSTRAQRPCSRANFYENFLKKSMSFLQKSVRRTAALQVIASLTRAARKEDSRRDCGFSGCQALADRVHPPSPDGVVAGADADVVVTAAPHLGAPPGRRGHRRQTGGAGVRSPLVLGAFAEELEAHVPEVVTAVHVAGIGAGDDVLRNFGRCLHGVTSRRD